MSAAFDVIRDAVEESFDVDAVEMVADIRNRLSIDVERRGKTVIKRSKPGEAPRRDTGRLWESISSAVERGLYGVEMQVYTDVPYSIYLQDPNALNRPHWSSLYDDWKAVVPDRLASKISSL